MNLTIKISLENFKQIIWPIVLIYMIKYFNILSTKTASLFYLGILFILILFMKKIVIPKVWGLVFYSFFILYSTIVGVLIYSLRDVVRDLYYVLPTVFLIILGYYCYKVYSDKLSIFKTIVLSGTLISTFTFIKMLGNLSKMTEFSGIRQIFDFCDYEVAMSFVFLFCYVFIKKERIFSKWFQRYSFIIMLGHIILSLARSVWIQVGLACLLAFAIEFYRKREQRIIIQFSKVVIACIVCLTLFMIAAPKSITDEFSEKFSKSTEELNAEQEFNNVDDAMQNWRAYEIQMAKKQWRESNVFIEVFGAGMGKGVHLQFVPYTWSEIVDEQNDIPLLHNGYYTVLPKGGLVGIAALVWLMLSNIIFCVKAIKKRDGLYINYIILFSICIAFLVQTYIVRGPVSQEANITWSLLVGWINAEIHTKKMKVVEANDISRNDNL